LDIQFLIGYGAEEAWDKNVIENWLRFVIVPLASAATLREESMGVAGTHRHFKFNAHPGSLYAFFHPILR
jgi:hypothetical protein